jgi:type IV pilus assembly protein PilX
MQKLQRNHASVQERSKYQGVSLIIVMIVLAVVSLLGIAGIQISSLGEKSARNDRDLQIAFQSAEAAFLDAEYDIRGPIASTRRAKFGADLSNFKSGCGTGDNAGLCDAVVSGLPAWLTVDFTKTDASAASAALGQFTNQPFKAGGSGLQPARMPRYVIEPIQDAAAGGTSRDRSLENPSISYRVTAIGYGPRDDIQTVIQGLVRP